MYNYDPELPRGFQDADFEQRELEQAANHVSALEKRGICTHGSVIDSDIVSCQDCGETWTNIGSWLAARREVLDS